MSRLELLKQIQAVGLVLDELRLYLDMHPEHQQAQSDYFEKLALRAKLMQQYTRNYGVLAWSMMQQSDSWQWVEGPWPWEREA